MDLTTVVLRAIERSGMSARQVSLKAFGHDSAIRDLKRTGNISTDRLFKLAEHLPLRVSVTLDDDEGLGLQPYELTIEDIRRTLSLPAETSIELVLAAARERLREPTLDKALELAVERAAERVLHSRLASIETIQLNSPPSEIAPTEHRVRPEAMEEHDDIADTIRLIREEARKRGEEPLSSELVEKVIRIIEGIDDDHDYNLPGTRS